MSVVIVVPSLKISGGIREALRLASELSSDGHSASVLTLWVSPHAMDSDAPVVHLSSWPPRAARALIELPVLTYRFAMWWRQAAWRAGSVVFTHYATLPLALLVPRRQRFFFVQDLFFFAEKPDWRFIGSDLLAKILRHFVLSVYRSGRIISANAFLSQRMNDAGLDVALEAPIWADPAFLAPDAPEPSIDFAMMLRKGELKRLDLYLRFIALATERQLRVAVITPEGEIAAQVRGKVNEMLLRPTLAQMRELYARSFCFVHLSEHEGFGLPPLEAMGAGCIPVCRDSGGVRAFMCDGPCADLLVPLSTPIEDIFARAEDVVRDSNHAARRAAAREHFRRGIARFEQVRKIFVGEMMKERGK